ncbi:MAG TPA: lysophospholipid acyltransferase family protein [Candidatus Hydrogenedentes bacterium]|nr:lysophospholipid acyltransferase family protein [Candidatus Hydrogenedentota bacterium]HRK34376.1 lysophospholipid acyltransferase family protein [Candidatus Hydrogenedentota bacterium]
MSSPELDFSTPVTFSLRQRLLLSVISTLIALLLRGIHATCKVVEHNRPIFDNAKREHGRVIIAVWHEVLPLGICIFRNSDTHTLTSYSYDGEMAARAVRKLGIFALRGSSSRGGSDALRRMEAAISAQKTVGITLDGPRGPRRVAKPGAAVLSARTGVPIIPVSFAASRYWRLKSWDKMVIPKPFTTIECSFGTLITPMDDNSDEAIELKRMELETTLNAAQEQLENRVGMRE